MSIKQIGLYHGECDRCGKEIGSLAVFDEIKRLVRELGWKVDGYYLECPECLASED